MLKMRCFKDKNYKAIFINDKTIRFAIDDNKPILDLDYPEFMDIKITDYCLGGCEYCYQNSKDTEHFYSIKEKLYNYFNNMTKNERPFQVAIGGGEPTEHPEFMEILKILFDLGIRPNYTTNGMNITNELLITTQKYCGGVAVSTHHHLKEHWENAVRLFIKNNIKTNLHCIISNKESIDLFLEQINKYKDDVYYFVVLPYIPQGRAIRKDLDFDYFFDNIKDINKKYYNKIAYGAKFYNELIKRNINISLYDTEIMSKFLDVKDMRVYPSSFDI